MQSHSLQVLILTGYIAAFCFPDGHALKLLGSSPLVMLEVHLENAKLVSGIDARPGLRITLVPQRAISSPSSLIEDHWLFISVNIYNMEIPAHEDYVELTVNFTLPLPPASFITVLASSSHMHRIGRGIWLEKRSPIHPAHLVTCDSAYNNLQQEIVPMTPTLDITNEDTLVLHCVYNSSSRSNYTKGGLQVRFQYSGLCIPNFLD